jgi:hypothetical protein
MFPLQLLGPPLADQRALRIQVPVLGAPAVRIKTTNPKGREQRFESQQCQIRTAANGIGHDLLFPSLGLTWEVERRGVGLGLRLGLQQSDHRFCPTDPKQLIPVAQISLLDIAEGVKEVQRVAKLGVKGAFMRAVPPKWVSKSFLTHARPQYQ